MANSGTKTFMVSIAKCCIISNATFLLNAPSIRSFPAQKMLAATRVVYMDSIFEYVILLKKNI